MIFRHQFCRLPEVKDINSSEERIRESGRSSARNWIVWSYKRIQFLFFESLGKNKNLLLIVVHIFFKLLIGEDRAMKIISTLLLASVTFPIGIALGTSYVSNLNDLLTDGNLSSLYSFSYNINSEPTLMILIGTGLIGIAGLGRKKLSNTDNKNKTRAS